MRVPLSWLKDFIALDTDPADDTGAVQALRATLDGLGLVVEGIEHIAAPPASVVLARVLEIHGIEGADKIRRVLVDAGAPEPLQIVCGAMNFVEGDVVPLATVGTDLGEGFVIAERTMRGVTSMGMLCSGRELGLSDDAAGLLVLASPGSPSAPLPGDVVLGSPLSSYLGLEPDVVFDVAVEPNRPDCLSMAGIARDLGAKLGLEFDIPAIHLVESERDASEIGRVAIHTPVGCSVLLGRVIEQVRDLVSPPLVRTRLERAGMRPINAVVDASNYVMLELGQPTHPYDVDRLGGHAIAVRLALPGEELVTLDGERRELGSRRDAEGDVVATEDLVIVDGSDRVVGLAGIMGGEDTEISPETSTVLLEVACFDPVFIGRTSQRLGLRSEASVRFWRGVDRDGGARAADRVCELVQAAAAYAGAPVPPVARGLLESRRGEPTVVEIEVRTARVNALLGTDLDPDTITGLLEPIGFACRASSDGLVVRVPSYRPDASREVDVIEEIARHYGYERLGRSPRRSPRVGRLSDHQARRRQLRSTLVGYGVTEAWTSSLIDPELARGVGAEGPFVEVLNPIIRNETALRSSLLPGMLQALVRNESHRNGDVALFEIGNVFGAPAPDGRPKEREQLGVLFGGEDATAAAKAFSYLADGLGLSREGYVVAQGETEGAADLELALGVHPSRHALVYLRRADPRSRLPVLLFGEVDPHVLAESGVQANRVAWMVGWLDALFALPKRSRRAAPVSRYPSADIDLAFVLADEVPAVGLAGEIEHAAGELLVALGLVDVYRGDALPAGTRSLTYRLRLGALDRTLGDEELAGLRRRVIAAVESRLPARLRA